MAGNSVQRAPPKAPIPVTLLSGFLGSGKTTLLRHILTSPETSLRIAVVVNDMAALNIDAIHIKKHFVAQAKEDENLIQLQNGCICCTLRGDLLEALVRIAKGGQADYIIIESTGISEPMQVAETFTEDFASAMVAAARSNDGGSDNESSKMDGLVVEGAEILEEIAEMGGLHKIVKLDTLITMVDAFNFFNNFSTTDFITNRWGEDGVAPEDERTVTDLLVDQIEFANVLIINKVDSVDEQIRQRIRNVVKQLNPDARVLEADYAQVNIQEVLATSSFDFEKAATGMGWLRSLHEMSKREIDGKVKIAPKPETEEYGISSFVYQARRPFHPRRLYQLIHDKFVMMENAEQDEESIAEDNDQDDELDHENKAHSSFDDQQSEGTSSDSEYGSNDNESVNSTSEVEMEEADQDLSKAVDPHTVAENKRNDPIFARLLRSKGFFWLATRPTLHGTWSQAGTMLTLQGGDQWFCTLSEDEWPKGEETKQSILNDFQEPWGDRRQEIVFIGERLDRKGLEVKLDSCLLTNSEMKKWERIMRLKRSPDTIQSKLDEAFEDGFEDWPDPSVMVDDDHDNTHVGHRH